MTTACTEGGWWGSGEKTEIIIGEKPFAVGTFHAVHCARLFGERYVVKFGLDPKDCTLEVYMMQLAAQHRAHFWAGRFNQACRQAGIQGPRVRYSDIQVADHDRCTQPKNPNITLT